MDGWMDAISLSSGYTAVQRVAETKPENEEDKRRSDRFVFCTIRGGSTQAGPPEDETRC